LACAVKTRSKWGFVATQILVVQMGDLIVSMCESGEKLYNIFIMNDFNSNGV